jgi:hypothetical protein
VFFGGAVDAGRGGDVAGYVGILPGPSGGESDGENETGGVGLRV